MPKDSLNAQGLIKELKKIQNSAKAKVLQGFFKTKPGQYGANDLFLGITVPEQRKIAKLFSSLPTSEVKVLLNNPFHEVRLCGVLILVDKYSRTISDLERKKLFNFYLQHRLRINNWDLVDLSAPNIVGDYCRHHPENYHLLKKLALSKKLWDRRIAMISCFAFIKSGSNKETYEIAAILLNDREDLMHKAVGWMIRETGKRVSRTEMLKFIKDNLRQLPRTTLRYAIEHLEENERKTILKS